ncbi:hypothetical protein, partial [Janthinobacterium sp.]|uniref:hypothetical protein n=1 Tax=Janthinobacterium sp. TaxID=1871054 RepID=UPI00258992BA
MTASYSTLASTASYVTTASWANNASTASYVNTAQTASYVTGSSIVNSSIDLTTKGLNSGNTPGTFYLITGTGAINNCSSGAANAIPPQVIYINSADYPTINGLAPKLRIRANLMTNATNITGTWTFGLFPITAGAGAVGVVSHTIGAVVAGSNGASQVNPLASQVYNLVGSDFALPA